MSTSTKEPVAQECKDSDLEKYHNFVKKLLGYSIKFGTAKKLYFPPGKTGAIIIVDTGDGFVQIQWQKNEFVRLN